MTPERIEENGRGGPGMKKRTRGVYELRPVGERRTEVTFISEVLEPYTLADRITAPLARAFLRRVNGRAMERLKALLEAGAREPAVTAAG